MSRFIRSLGLATVSLLMLTPGQALATTVNVSAVDNDFVPPTATIRQGDTVHWTNDGVNPHTATGNDPLALWDSGTLFADDTFDFVFTAAGGYAYRCEFHVTLGMTGTIRVRERAFPMSGPVGTQFTVVMASVPASAPFVYDVQRANPGQGFRTWMTGLTDSSTIFDSTGRPTGTYRFRSRLRNTSTGAFSAWSPAASISVTP